jgi:hypothetical protein
MSWCYLSDTSNEELWELSNPAYRLYVAGLVDCNRRLSDGVIPASRLPALVPDYQPLVAAELAAANLWRAVDGGYRVVRYLRPDGWQYSRAQVEKHRADGARRWRDFKEREKLGLDANTNTNTNTNTQRVSQRVSESNDDFLEGSDDGDAMGSTGVAVKVVAALDGYEKLGMVNIPEIVESLIADARKKNAPSAVVPTIQSWFKDWMVRAGVEAKP